ncbi:MAG: DUF6095 family protein, partial [Flavobacteriales bacterium]
MSPEAKEILTKGIRVLSYALIPLFSVPLLINFAFSLKKMSFLTQILSL